MWNAYGWHSVDGDFGRARISAQVANEGKRMADRTTGAPTIAEAMIALAQRIALAMKYFRFMAPS
jgi:hypothetical protein